MKGSLLFLLHAHLPYVRHPEHEHALEESWLYEALWETYLPLLGMLERLGEEGICPCITLTLSPPLIEMLGDELLKKRFLGFVEDLASLADAEKRRTRSTPFEPLPFLYSAKLRTTRQKYLERYGGDLGAAFRKLQDEGLIEIAATAATHAFLPAFEHYPEAVRRQIALGIQSYQRAFGRRPRGFWLPECGYFQGLDSVLGEAGIGYFFLEAHGLVHGRPCPAFSIYQPIQTPAGVAAFGRDVRASQQVWCASRGYPGDPFYRDFYRDIGFDLPSDDLAAFPRAGLRSFTGIKYHRVTGPGAEKLPYDRPAAIGRATLHAEHFVQEREAELRRLAPFGREPVFFTPFDAELFGHWWFEGVEWLEAVLRRCAEQTSSIRIETPARHFERTGALMSAGPLQPVRPAPSSWGKGGYSAVWIGEQSHLLYRRLHGMEEKMERLLRSARSARTTGRKPQSAAPARQALLGRAVVQALRETLLAQASDWAFLIEHDRASAYAAHRVAAHRERFDLLYAMVSDNAIEERRLEQIEAADPIFPWLALDSGSL